VAPDVLAFGQGGGGGGAGGGEGEGGGGEGEMPPTALDELRHYLVGAFGSAQRLDYGTGHELSFLAFLGCLWKLGGFADGGADDGEVERSIVLGVVEPCVAAPAPPHSLPRRKRALTAPTYSYLNVVRGLILAYTLEPAGSHGVWGLDDHSFLPYIFGSAQLARPVADGEPLPQEGSTPRAARPADVLDADAVAAQRGLNMYFAAVGFINDVKKGPFWEHSPILFDVSGIKDGWGKINKVQPPG